MADDDQVLVADRRDRVWYLTLNRPPHNSLDEQLCTALRDTCRDIDADADAVAVVIQGAGGRAFCAGGDIRWMAGQGPHEWHVIAHDLIHGAINAVGDLRMPVIAGVDGYALGGGTELALACDWVIATSTSTFGLPEVQLGVFPGGGGSQRLPRAIPIGTARRMILTGQRFTAQEAHDYGLVARVVDGAAELEEAIAADVSRLRDASTHAVRLAKRAIADGVEMPLSQALRYEADLVSLLFGTPDQRDRFTKFGRPG